MVQNRAVDPLDWLEARSSEPSVEVRESTLVQTQRVLRGRRHLRRAVRLTAVIVVYVAGMASMEAWRTFVRQDAMNREPVVVDARRPSDQPAGSTVSNPGSTANAMGQARPEQPPKTQFEIMRDAADRVWERSGDIALASRLYARAVHRASAAELAASADDNWLLLSLKEARIQEMKYAHVKLKS